MKTAFHFVKALLLLVLLAAPLSAVAGAKFLSAIEDLPLMSGLSEVDDGVMVFDSPAGRIVEALTVGPVGKADVLRYYSQTLPQLGWRESAPGRFSREGEILILEFPPPQTLSGSGPPAIGVRFMLSPDT